MPLRPIKMEHPLLLNLRYNFLFVHIAKTGGTSIRSALTWYKRTDPFRFPMMICSRISALCGHRIGAKLPRHAKAIAAREMLPRNTYDRLFKFVFVRNPWDLQVSSYHHIQTEHPHLLKGIESFDQFLEYKLDPDRLFQYQFDMSIVHQYDYTVDLNGTTIVDFIGRFEDLESDFRKICRHIGGPGSPQLPHKRKAGKRSHYRDYYCPRTRQLVAEFFRKDIEMFNYSF